WKLAGTDANGKPSQVGVSVPLVATGRNCEWTAWLELSSPGGVDLIRTIGYQQRGSFEPVAGKARIEAVWELPPFFVGPTMPDKQGFTFRMLDVRCGVNMGRVDNPGYREGDTEPGVFVMSFAADVSAGSDSRDNPTPVSREPGADPRVIGTATIEPIDNDHDG